jgi:hypothetical protein
MGAIVRPRQATVRYENGYVLMVGPRDGDQMPWRLHHHDRQKAQGYVVVDEDVGAGVYQAMVGAAAYFSQVGDDDGDV